MPRLAQPDSMMLAPSPAHAHQPLVDADGGCGELPPLGLEHPMRILGECPGEERGTRPGDRAAERPRPHGREAHRLEAGICAWRCGSMTTSSKEDRIMSRSLV